MDLVGEPPVYKRRETLEDLSHLTVHARIQGQVSFDRPALAVITGEGYISGCGGDYGLFLRSSSFCGTLT